MKAKIDVQDEILPSEFWGTVERYLHFGSKATNEHDHSSEIRFRAQQVFVDQINSIFQSMPDGWIKSTAALHRHVMHVGAYVTWQYLRKFKHDLIDPDLQELTNLHNKMVKVEKILRINEMRLKMGTINAKLRANQDAKVVPMLSSMEKSLRIIADSQIKQKVVKE